MNKATEIFKDCVAADWVEKYEKDLVPPDIPLEVYCYCIYLFGEIAGDLKNTILT